MLNDIKTLTVALGGYIQIFYSIPLYSILFYSILFYSILLYSILFYYILFYSILFYSILFYFISSICNLGYWLLELRSELNNTNYLTFAQYMKINTRTSK